MQVAGVAEMESLRFGNDGVQDGPGPGAYSIPDGMADDNKKWLVAATWSKGERQAATEFGTPGPATYEVGTPFGALSPKVKFGHSKRFPDGNDTRCHAYLQLDHAPASPSPVKGTFSLAADRSTAHPTSSPGPKYYIQGMGSTADVLLQRRRRRHVSTAPRFPEAHERSPGPIYSINNRSTKGVKLPPRTPSSDRKAKYLADTHASVEPFMSDGTRLIQKNGELVKVFVSTGATASSGAFGKKTKRDTIFYKSDDGPGPQNYEVHDEEVKRSNPAFSFGSHQGTSYELQNDGKKAGTAKPMERKPNTDSQAVPGPGAYVLESKSNGPSFSIAYPVGPVPKATPGPTSYKQNVQRTNKPKVPTFSRSSRFKELSETVPGPGYYANPALSKGCKHGVSTSCPDVIGWMEKKKQAAIKHKEACVEMSRRMVIMGSFSEHSPQRNSVLPEQVAERPRGTTRTIWY